MGLISFGRALLSGAARGLGIGGTAASLPAIGGLSRIGQIAATAAPSIGFGAVGAGLANLFGIGAGGAPAAAPAATGQRQFVQLQDGSMVLVGRNGVPIRAQLFLPAGTKLPAGATVVSVSPGATLFGIRKRRSRKTFQGEITRCKTVISDAKSLVKAVQKK